MIQVRGSTAPSFFTDHRSAHTHHTETPDVHPNYEQAAQGYDLAIAGERAGLFTWTQIEWLNLQSTNITIFSCLMDGSSPSDVEVSWNRATPESSISMVFSIRHHPQGGAPPVKNGLFDPIHYRYITYKP